MNAAQIYRWVVFFISIILLLLPFFWFQPGEMDLGGDSSRLYFYNPFAYLTNYALYGISPSSFGAENIGYFMIPYVLLLFILKFFVMSPTFLIALVHGINFLVAFLSCYYIVKELLSKKENRSAYIPELASLTAGLSYVFSQTSILGWDKVLTTHNQFFLNPLLFLLLLKYCKTDRPVYLGVILLITFLFTPNFSFAAAPGFFAFYPLSMFFLFLYRFFVIKKNFIWKHIMVMFIVFMCLQLFHILPQLVSMFSPGSVLNTAVFTDVGKFDRGLSYFLAIAPNIKVSLSLMNLPQMTALFPYAGAFILFPAIIILGFFYNQTRTLLLSGMVFLIVLFFATANITELGFEIYKKMFSLPGFSIFRNYFGQWGYALLFFFVILFGQALAILLSKMNAVRAHLLTVGLILLLLFSAQKFFTGELVNKMLWQSKNIHIFMKMDPQYEELLRFVTALPVDGKVLTLPLTDPGYQIIVGTNNGAYQGPSTISYLAGKQDFAGFEEFGIYKSTFATLVKKKDYAKLRELLGYLNIRYLVYNADPRVYDTTFPAFPYTDVRRIFPGTQKEYQEFLEQLSVKQIKNINNTYFVFEVSDADFQPKIFAKNDATYYTKKINDLSLLLSFNEPKNVTLEPYYFVPLSSKVVTELDKSNLFTQIIKNSNPPRFLHNAFAKTPPSSRFYKPSVIKEYFDLHKQIRPDYFIENRMFLSSKLLFELERWGHDMPVFSEETSVDDLFQKLIQIDQERTLIWELQSANNSWEALLTRYVRNLTESFLYIEQSSNDQQWKDRQTFLLYEYYLSHRQRFDAILQGSSMPTNNKEQLSRVLTNLFNYWFERMALPDLLVGKNEYIIPATDLNGGSASLYIEKEDVGFVENGEFGIQIGGQEVAISEDQDELYWVKLDTNMLDFSQENILKVIPKSRMNLMDTAENISIKNTLLDDTVRQSTIHNGLVWKIHNWKPERYYLLSFEYKNPDVSYSVVVYEKKMNGKKEFESTEILKNQLKSDNWERYQAVFRLSDEVDEVFIQMERDGSENKLGEFSFRNMSMIYLPQPEMLLRITKEKEYTENPPMVSFTKINSTKYYVTVKESNSPYYLVFNQTFNNKWKVYKDNSEGGFSLNKVFDSNALETFTKKPLFESSHYSVNGGMNAWYIDPKDLGEKKSYSFIIEFTTQRYFYIGFLISFITFVGVVVYTIYSLVRHEK